MVQNYKFEIYLNKEHINIGSVRFVHRHFFGKYMKNNKCII